MIDKMPSALRRIYKAFFYSSDGAKAMFVSEPAFRQDLCVFVIGIVLLLFADVSKTEMIVMLLSLFLLLMAETANTAIEVIIDRISEEIHPLSKKAKDIGSFLVLLAIVNLLFVYGSVLFF